jgi:hypothetical protein
MPKLKHKDLMDYELMHDHGGGPWVMVEDCDSEYCRLTDPGQTRPTRAFLAWKQKLQLRFQMETDEDGNKTAVAVKRKPNPQLDEVREGIASGQLLVKDTRIVHAALVES